nr:zinc ribbon domain-containing protein [Roseovarius sp. M141]
MRTKTRGIPRDGDLLLHGIVWCGRCGHKMYVRYKGGGEYVRNHLRTHSGLPTCQHIRAEAVDAAVADAFLTALAPAELDALSRARRAQSKVDGALRANAEREVERTRYAAALAQRQYNRVDPDNRLVAAELERRWESALMEARAAEAALAEQSAQQPTAPLAMGKAFTGKVVALAGRLPQIWADPATTDAHRKSLPALPGGQGGARPDVRARAGPHRMARRGGDRPRCQNAGHGDRKNSLGVAKCGRACSTWRKKAGPTMKLLAFSPKRVTDRPTVPTWFFPSPCNVSGWPKASRRPPSRRRWEHDPGFLSTTELAAKLGIPVNWLYVQIKKKRLLIEPQPTGAYLFPDTSVVLDGVQNLRNHVIGELDLRICQPDNGGYQHG